MGRKELIYSVAKENSKGVGGNWEVMRKGAELWFIRGALWSDKHPKWININDGLPPKNKDNEKISVKVLVAYKDIKDKNNYIYNTDWYDYETEEWFYGRDEIVMYWMEIIPPEETNKPE